MARTAGLSAGSTPTPAPPSWPWGSARSGARSPSRWPVLAFGTGAGHHLGQRSAGRVARDGAEGDEAAGRGRRSGGDMRFWVARWAGAPGGGGGRGPGPRLHRGRRRVRDAQDGQRRHGGGCAVRDGQAHRAPVPLRSGDGHPHGGPRRDPRCPSGRVRRQRRAGRRRAAADHADVGGRSPGLRSNLRGAHAGRRGVTRDAMAGRDHPGRVALAAQRAQPPGRPEVDVLRRERPGPGPREVTGRR